ncbi:putative vco30 [Vibrio parahaemolyticus VPTS-2009]|nr:putative vco30 [Vibrio parahaemolyticus VPTS-2009]
MVFNAMGGIGRSCRLLANSERKISLTNSSRGIHNAWHFYYALFFSV